MVAPPAMDFGPTYSYAPIPRTLVSSIAFLALLAALLYLFHEYQMFKALGPGGTPANLAGFAKIFLLSFAKVSDPYRIPELGRTSWRGIGFLHELPARRRARPETRGIAPHRQVTQQGDPFTYESLCAAIESLRMAPTDLYIATSCFEKHSTGLFAAHPVNRTCAGEICHTHPSDGGSMHLTLCPADAKVVLEAGWGERHPLSRGGWFERFVPAGFVMVYAPRDEREVGVVMEIVDAAAWFVSGGVDLRGKTEGVEEA